MVWLFKFMHITVSYMNWIMYCKPIWCSQIIKRAFNASYETISSAVKVILYHAYFLPKMLTDTLQLLSPFQNNILVNLIKISMQDVLRKLYEITKNRIQGQYTAELIANISKKLFILI